MNKGSIVERLCSDLDRKEPRYKSPTLLYFYFTSATDWGGGKLACCTARRPDYQMGVWYVELHFSRFTIR